MAAVANPVMPIDLMIGDFGGVLDVNTSKQSHSSSDTMEPAACTQCGTVSTPQWRAGPAGPRTLCNACGLQYVRSQNRQVKRRAGGSKGSAVSKARQLASSHVGRQQPSASPPESTTSETLVAPVAAHPPAGRRPVRLAAAMSAHRLAEVLGKDSRLPGLAQSRAQPPSYPVSSDSAAHHYHHQQASEEVEGAQAGVSGHGGSLMQLGPHCAWVPGSNADSDEDATGPEHPQLLLLGCGTGRGGDNASDSASGSEVGAGLLLTNLLSTQPAGGPRSGGVVSNKRPSTETQVQGDATNSDAMGNKRSKQGSGNQASHLLELPDESPALVPRAAHWGGDVHEWGPLMRSLCSSDGVLAESGNSNNSSHDLLLGASAAPSPAPVSASDMSAADPQAVADLLQSCTAAATAAGWCGAPAVDLTGAGNNALSTGDGEPFFNGFLPFLQQGQQQPAADLQLPSLQTSLFPGLTLFNQQQGQQQQLQLPGSLLGHNHVAGSEPSLSLLAQPLATSAPAAVNYNDDKQQLVLPSLQFQSARSLQQQLSQQQPPLSVAVPPATCSMPALGPTVNTPAAGVPPPPALLTSTTPAAAANGGASSAFDTKPASTQAQQQVGAPGVTNPQDASLQQQQQRHCKPMGSSLQPGQYSMGFPFTSLTPPSTILPPGLCAPSSNQQGTTPPSAPAAAPAPAPASNQEQGSKRMSSSNSGGAAAAAPVVAPPGVISRSGCVPPAVLLPPVATSQLRGVPAGSGLLSPLAPAPPPTPAQQSPPAAPTQQQLLQSTHCMPAVLNVPPAGVAAGNNSGAAAAPAAAAEPPRPATPPMVPTPALSSPPASSSASVKSSVSDLMAGVQRQGLLPQSVVSQLMALGQQAVAAAGAAQEAWKDVNEARGLMSAQEEQCGRARSAAYASAAVLHSCLTGAQWPQGLDAPTGVTPATAAAPGQQLPTSCSAGTSGAPAQLQTAGGSAALQLTSGSQVREASIMIDVSQLDGSAPSLGAAAAAPSPCPTPAPIAPPLLSLPELHSRNSTGTASAAPSPAGGAAWCGFITEQASVTGAPGQALPAADAKHAGGSTNIMTTSCFGMQLLQQQQQQQAGGGGVWQQQAGAAPPSRQASTAPPSATAPPPSSIKPDSAAPVPVWPAPCSKQQDEELLLPSLQLDLWPLNNSSNTAAGNQCLSAFSCDGDLEMPLLSSPMLDLGRGMGDGVMNGGALEQLFLDDGLMMGGDRFSLF